MTAEPTARLALIKQVGTAACLYSPTCLCVSEDQGSGGETPDWLCNAVKGGARWSDSMTVTLEISMR